MRKLSYLLLCFFPFFLSAQNIKIAMAIGEWPPYTSKKMKNYGMASEIVTSALKEVGIEPQYESYPFKRIFLNVSKGKKWAAFPYAYTKKRAKEVIYSKEPIIKIKDKLFYYKKRPVKEFKELKDLKSITIGGCLGYWYNDLFKNAGLSIEYANRDLNSLKKLIIGRVDVVPMDEVAGWALIKKNFPDQVNNFKTFEKALKIKGSFLISSKKYPGSKELLKKFETGFKLIKEKGIYKKILEKYGLK